MDPDTCPEDEDGDKVEADDPDDGVDLDLIDCGPNGSSACKCCCC